VTGAPAQFAAYMVVIDDIVTMSAARRRAHARRTVEVTNPQLSEVRDRLGRGVEIKSGVELYAICGYWFNAHGIVL
jgi:hypothetical protein